MLIITTINETNNYNELDGSFKYFEKQYAYHILDANALSLNAQTGQYYYDLKNSNIGKYDEIYRKIEVGDINNASLLNNQTAPVNSIEQYRKWVNAVYFDYIVTQKEIPQNIIEDLEILASSSPFVNGDAVYTARAIVGYTESVVNPKSLEQENDTNSSSEITAKVYPNPANDKLFIEIKATGDEKLNFLILNSLGVKLKEVSLQKNTVIDVSRLNNGLYFYQILRTFNQEITDKGRFVISR
ncbi:MAG: T9SS type A sorting domain-containing protein [Bacteroidales bacterium]|jgi:hypothetical protein|nr:T9SS type A sorting domain-containing protein [Bacteroidales bacterium]